MFASTASIRATSAPTLVCSVLNPPSTAANVSVRLAFTAAWAANWAVIWAEKRAKAEGGDGGEGAMGGGGGLDGG